MTTSRRGFLASLFAAPLIPVVVPAVLAPAPPKLASAPDLFHVAAGRDANALLVEDADGRCGMGTTTPEGRGVITFGDNLDPGRIVYDNRRSRFSLQ